MHLLLKRLYGSTSEKRDPRQGDLFDSHGNGDDKVEETAASARTRPRRPRHHRPPRSVTGTAAGGSPNGFNARR